MSSFSPFANGSGGNINVLPIELFSFTASANGDIVTTQWVTSTEINNNFFSVERSQNLKDFKEIGRVEAAENSTSKIHYSFADKAPYFGISYYRLKQTNYDGSSTYSEVKAVKFVGDQNYKLLQVFRSDESLNLVYRAESKLLNVEAYDLLTRVRFSFRVQTACKLLASLREIAYAKL